MQHDDIVRGESGDDAVVVIRVSLAIVQTGKAKAQAIKEVAEAEAYAVERLAKAEGDITAPSAMELARIRADSKRLESLGNKTTVFLPTGGELSEGIFRGVGRQMGKEVVSGGSSA